MQSYRSDFRLWRYVIQFLLIQDNFFPQSSRPVVSSIVVQLRDNLHKVLRFTLS